MKISNAKLILPKIKADYRKGHLYSWADYEGQKQSEIKLRMRQTIRYLIRSIRKEKIDKINMDRIPGSSWGNGNGQRRTVDEA
jgi:hypothetical protein